MYKVTRLTYAISPYVPFRLKTKTKIVESLNFVKMSLAARFT